MGSLVNVTFCCHCWRSLTDSTTTEEAPSHKANGSGKEAWGHIITWGYWSVRQILVISCHSCLEENRGLLFLWKLQEAEWLFPTTGDTLAAAKGFSTLDLKSTYWQVMLHPDREKIACSIGQGLWKFIVMPFGLCSVPVMFEQLMEAVLCGLIYKSCLVYLDSATRLTTHSKNKCTIYRRYSNSQRSTLSSIQRSSNSSEGTRKSKEKNRTRKYLNSKEVICKNKRRKTT